MESVENDTLDLVNWVENVTEWGLENVNVTELGRYYYWGESFLDLTEVRIPLILLYLLVFLCSFFGNLLILIVLGVHQEMRSPTSFFLANLAVADLLVSVFCVVQNAIHLVISENAHWPFGALLCQAYCFVLRLVPCTSTGLLMLMSIEKYIAVLHPLTARKLLTNQLRIALTAIVWLGATVVNLPYYLNAKHIRYNPNLAACTRDVEMSLYRGVVTISFLVGYCIPLGVMAVLYWRIGTVLWQSAKRGIILLKRQSTPKVKMGQRMTDGSLSTAASMELKELATPTGQENQPAIGANNGPITAEEPAEVTNQHRTSNNFTMSLKASSDGTTVLDARKKVVRLLIAVVASFAILTLPIHLYFLWQIWLPHTHTYSIDSPLMLIHPVSYLLLFTNSGINPFLYAFLSVKFRQAAADLLLWLCSCGRDISLQQYVESRRMRSSRSRTTNDRKTTTTLQTVPMLAPTNSNRHNAHNNSNNNVNWADEQQHIATEDRF